MPQSNTNQSNGAVLTEMEQASAGTVPSHLSQTLEAYVNLPDFTEFLPRVPQLGRHEAHVWKLSPGSFEASAYEDLLSWDERKRASGFRFKHLADRYILDHARLRVILGAYAQIDPRKLVFGTNSYDKLHIKFPDCSLRFNLSHTEGLTMIAVCRDAEIGVDIEAIHPLAEWEEIASSHFSHQENRALQSTPESDRMNAFFRCWTRKEAFVKAKGQGLSIPLDAFSVSISAEHFPAILHCEWDAHEASRWSLIDLEPGAGFVGAISIEGPVWNIRQFDWSPRRKEV